MAISTVFTNNRSQAIRLPVELRLPDSIKKVNIRALGNDRIISPIGQTWDSFFLVPPMVSDDFMEERDSQEQSEREAF
jgi:antitoxin VapB